MASRSLGELLLRPSTFTRIPQRTCPHNPRWISQTASRPAQPARKDQNDPYSLSSQSRRERPSILSDLAPPPSQRPQQPNPRRSGPASANDAIRAIDSLVESLPTTSKARKQPSSADEMRAARNANQAFGANFAKPGGRFTRGANRPRGLQFEEMESIPGEGEDMLPGLVQQETPAELLAAQQEATLSNYPRLNPSYGRTVTLDAKRGRDIVRGIGMMGMMMARNKVKLDFNRQKFHERGGLKRKRLNSERWRARFKLGFRAVTERVNALTRKGW